MADMSNNLTIRLNQGEASDPVGKGERIISASKLSGDVLGSLSSLSSITLELSSNFEFDPLSLASIVPSLSKDGNAKIMIKIPKDADSSSVHTAIVLSGLTAESERTEHYDESVPIRVITSAYRPPKASTIERIRIPSMKNTGPAVKINIDLDDDGFLDDDINEDDLLNDTTNGLNAPAAVDTSNRTKDDCDGRKPCDDCTCGRAEQENSNNTEERKIVKDFKSNCGNCAKGDAFRCAGCPYLGKPAFKEGEQHLVLDLDDDF